MKAIDYFEQYPVGKNVGITEAEFKQELYALFMAFNDEVKDLVKVRHAATNDAAIGIILEQNDKWNCLCRIYEKKQGFSPIAKDGFYTFWNKEIGVTKR